MSEKRVAGDLVPWPTFPECPDCTGRDWHFGPRGGASINIKCLGCDSWFNAVFLLAGVPMIQRIDKAS
jgi:hypothetical protein